MSYALEGQRWSSTAISWSFEQSGTSTEGGLSYSSAINDPTAQSLVEQAVDDWQAESGITFYQVPDHQDPGDAPDIRIGFGALLGQPGSSDTIGDTDYYYYPDDDTFAPGVYVALQDTGITPLHTDATGALVYGNYSSSFLSVALHELGHALGLAHDPGDAGAIMNPVLSASNRALDADDIAGIQALYGANHGQGTPGNELFLSGSHDQYTLAQTGGGALSVIDGVANRDGTTSIATDRFYGFTDGIGFSDPTGNGEQIARLYLSALDRAPDGLGLLNYTEAADNGESLSAIADAIASSPEAMGRFGALNNMQFITQAYEGVLHRAPDAGGLNSYENALSNGTSRATVVLALAESQEARASNLPLAGDHDDAEVTRLYGTALDRAADPTGLASWGGALDGGASVASIAAGITGSAEFASLYGGMGDTAFVQALYQNTLHRAADAPGLANWTGQLAAGASRASVVVGFADSVENRVLTAGATHDGVVFLGG